MKESQHLDREPCRIFDHDDGTWEVLLAMCVQTDLFKKKKRIFSLPFSVHCYIDMDCFPLVELDSLG